MKAVLPLKESMVAAMLLVTSMAALAGPAEIEALRKQPGVPYDAAIEAVKSTPQVDEWDLPDLRGEYDDLIPVPENYPLPEVPSRMHDVATFRDGRWIRPIIPMVRTTNDGRLGIAPGGDSTSRAWQFFLYAPEKLEATGTHYTQMSDGAGDLMSSKVFKLSYEQLVPEETGLASTMFAVCETSYSQLDNEIYGHDNETIHRNPYPISENEEAYDLTIVTADLDVALDDTDKKTTMIGIKVRVVVQNPKTPEAEIVRVERVGELDTVVIPSRPLTVLEPSISGDGRLYVYRTSGTPGAGGGFDAAEPRPWVDANGVTRYSRFDIVYDYNPPGSGYPPCDVRGWTNPRPLSYAHHDPEVRKRYGFAKFPLRDAEGVLVPPGEDTGAMYPWLDRRGANVMFTTTKRFPISNEFTYTTEENIELLETLSGEHPNAAAREQALYGAGVKIPAKEVRPHLMMPIENQRYLPDEDLHCTGCFETAPDNHAAPISQVGVMGLWTQGKMVQIDGIVNATELHFPPLDESHRLIRLYHGQGGVVRMGNGRLNKPVPEWADVDTHWQQVDSAMDTLENKLNFAETLKPIAPYDVVWAVSTGRGTSEVIFDDYMDNEALILSEMVASVSTMVGPITYNRPNNGDRFNVPLRVQNSSTRIGDFTAAYGEVFGDTKNGTRIEPAALGGIYGKGLWLTPGAGVRYSFPVTGAAEAAAKDAAYYGIALDPRFSLTDAAEHRVLTTPTGTLDIATGESTELVIRGVETVAIADAGALEYRVPLPQMQEGQWIHVGVEVARGDLTVYVDGFRYFNAPLAADAVSLLQVATGDVIVGSKNGIDGGFRGWIDEFKVFSRPVLNPEEACNRSMGSLVRVPRASGDQGYPAQSHQLIAQALGEDPSNRYACARDYDSEGFAFLARIAPEDRIGLKLRKIKPLVFDQPRPDETDNAFCTVCHTSNDHVSETMALDALVHRDLPMQFDLRRQPLQPYPAAIGLIPAAWLGHGGNGFPQGDMRFSEIGEWLWVDAGLLSPNGNAAMGSRNIEPQTAEGRAERAMINDEANQGDQSAGGDELSARGLNETRGGMMTMEMLLLLVLAGLAKLSWVGGWRQRIAGRWVLLATAGVLTACQGGRMDADLDARSAEAMARDSELVESLLSNPGKHFFVNQICDGAPDTTPIDWTRDPRRMLQADGFPGSKNLIDSERYAVHFNDPYEICHTETLFETQARQNELRAAEGKDPIYSAKPDPATCGEWRRAVQHGHDWVAMTSSSQPHTGNHVGGFSPGDWNMLWKLWGMDERPENFDEELYERYGHSPAPAHIHNPYPIIDPDRGIDEREMLSESFGGSGRLPLGFAQARNADGAYSGAIGITCFSCHAGQIGQGEVASRDGLGNAASYGGNARGTFMGLPNTNTELGVLYADLITVGQYGWEFRDNIPVSTPAAGYIPLINTTRGTNAADTEIEYMVISRDFDSLETGTRLLTYPLHGNTGDQDPPAWWWLSNKTRYLWFGGHSTDSSRGNMYFGSVNDLSGEQVKGLEGTYEDVHQWSLTIEAPDYPADYCASSDGSPSAADHPGCINKPLAIQGAILFHEKDLWADGKNADIPRPKGNGSCAGCHGAYAPRYANDPRFLPDPALAGTVGYTVPIEIIDTDPAQAEGWASEIREHVSTFWWSYPDAMEGYRMPEEKDDMTERMDDYLFHGVSGEDFSDHLARLFGHSGAVEPLADAIGPVLAASVGQLPNFGLGESVGRIKGACSFEEKTVGYVTPPLHGVWASAPYFHNGSVPDVWGVLDPDSRPAVWRRQRTTTPVHFNAFETRIHGEAGGYNWERMGWNYDLMNCGDGGMGVPYYTCQPAADMPQEVQWGADLLIGGVLWPTWIVPPPVGEQGLEDRMVFSTNMYSKKNRGHEWTRALSDTERRALLEYLKIL